FAWGITAGEERDSISERFEKECGTYRDHGIGIAWIRDRHGAIAFEIVGIVCVSPVPRGGDDNDARVDQALAFLADGGTATSVALHVVLQGEAQVHALNHHLVAIHIEVSNELQRRQDRKLAASAGADYTKIVDADVRTNADDVF